MNSSPESGAPAGALVIVNRYCYPDRSATSQILFDLAEAVSATGRQVHVFCSRQLYDDAKARLAPFESYHGVDIHRVFTTRFGRGALLGRSIDYASFYVSVACKLLWRLRRGDVLIAKTDPPLLSILAAPLARMKGAILINWQQDVFPEVASELGANPLPRWLDARLRRWRDASLKAARLNVTVGERMQEYLHQRGIPMAQIKVVENWSDSRAIVPKPSSESALRQRLGLGRDFVVGYSGNLGRAHESEALLGAAVRLRDDPAVTFLFIGGGVKMEALRSAARERTLTRVCFLPYQPRESLEDSLAAADVHLASLLPSLEGLIVPSKFYGILAAGRPVIFIGDQDGELARIIRQERCGIIVPAGDADALVAAIARLKADPELCAAMGVAARSLAGRYSLESGVIRWLTLLQGLNA
ncbi:MAG TPA: glycosyltransferase family 4 protein [Steroidobacteraceae bacterium]|jgi:glycosyltransferase involved in cell wall biosynthesis